MSNAIANTESVMSLGQWPALLSASQSAAYLSIGERTFQRIASSDVIKPVRLGDRTIRYRRDELDAYIQSLPRGRGERPPT